MRDPLSRVHWIESFLDLNAVKVPGPPGRWQRMYREADVRAVLDWADMHLQEERRLVDLMDRLAKEARRVR